MNSYETIIDLSKALAIPIVYSLITFFFERKKNTNKKSLIKLIVLFIKFYLLFVCSFFLALFSYFVSVFLYEALISNMSHGLPAVIRTILTMTIPCAIPLTTIRILRKQHLNLNEINLFAVCNTIISLIIFLLIDKILLINFYFGFSILFCWLVFAISILASLIKMIAKFIHSRKKDKNNGDENIKE